MDVHDVLACGLWDASQDVTLVPNPHYTALPPDLLHPRAAQIRFAVLTSSELWLAQTIAQGNVPVDVGEGFTLADSAILQTAPGFSTIIAPTTRVEHLEYNLDGVLSDRRLREALDEAIDRAAFLRAQFPTVPDTEPFLLNSVIPRVSPWNDPTLPPSPYDPDHARALLAQAGYATSTDPAAPGRHLSIILTTTPNPARQREAQALAQYWQAIGVTVSARYVSPMGNGGLFQGWDNGGVLVHRAFDIALFSQVLPQRHRRFLQHKARQARRRKPLPPAQRR